MWHKLIDLTGRTFGLWKVIERDIKTLKGHAKWICRCSGCNRFKSICGSDLRLGKSKGCKSCTQRGNSRGTIHGMVYHFHYKRKSAMIDRCYNKNNKFYNGYGGRGIFICRLWRNNPKAFCEWADAQPRNRDEGYSIDRIDNNGPYAPWNCKFSTAKEQNNNKRNNVS